MINQLLNITPLAKGGQKEVYVADHPKHGRVAFKKMVL